MTNPNDPAIPCVVEEEGILMQKLGLTKREHLAALCLQGLSHDSIIEKQCGDDTAVALSKVAVSLADALIVELNRHP